jgi:hypothetical protein
MKLSIALGDFEGMNQIVDTTEEDLSKRYEHTTFSVLVVK